MTKPVEDRFRGVIPTIMALVPDAWPIVLMCTPQEDGVAISIIAPGEFDVEGARKVLVQALKSLENLHG